MSRDVTFHIRGVGRRDGEERSPESLVVSTFAHSLSGPGSEQRTGNVVDVLAAVAEDDGEWFQYTYVSADVDRLRASAARCQTHTATADATPAAKGP